MDQMLSDDRVVIRNLQKMLRLIGLAVGETAYQIGVSGVYGEGTRNAVRAYQLKNNLPVTGSPDQETWERIAADYRRFLPFTGQTAEIRPFPMGRGTAVRSGEQSDLVKIIQLMLRTLDLRYDFGYVPENGIYDITTAEAVVRFQQLNDLPSPSGAVDRLTWNKLAEEYNRIVNED